jgi:hypothetical protein
MLFLWLTAGLHLSIYVFGFIALPFAAAGVSDIPIYVFRCIAVTALCSLFILRYTYSHGYKKADYKFKRGLILLLTVCVIQFVIAYLLHFAEYTSGGAYYLARILYGAEVRADNEVPTLLYTVSMIIVETVYIIAGLSGAYFGTKNRLSDRRKLEKQI